MNSSLLKIIEKENICRWKRDSSGEIKLFGPVVRTVEDVKLNGDIWFFPRKENYNGKIHIYIEFDMFTWSELVNVYHLFLRDIYSLDTYSPEGNSRTFSYMIMFCNTWKAQIIWKMCHNIFVWLTW